VGLIALREGEGFVVHASFHSLPAGERLPLEGLDVRELTVASPATIAEPGLVNPVVIAPLIASESRWAPSCSARRAAGRPTASATSI
jgi:hypothetical protein